ncbi:MAG: endolytic transglycosylase MltG, partial [Bacteroidales bacterium]|nr:endolytic transglycosylase MltG [Bacteroidales bacterium]
KNLPSHIHPGKYEIHGGMSNNELINLLRSGQQTPVNLIFNNISTKPQLARRLADQIEADSLSLISLMEDPEYPARFGFTGETILCMFLPNTYEVFWNITPEKLFERMNREYKAFWNENRSQKAAYLKLSPVEVGILASIVEKETAKEDEKPSIAGVYLNRLKYGWKLQADPTIIYAWGDFSINRVLNIHKQLDSPYNTYLYSGLPPGPICLPSISSIESVLNAETHDYFFFCARADFSGYHEFARTASRHAVNANKYRRALDERGIMK